MNYRVYESRRRSCQKSLSGWTHNRESGPPSQTKILTFFEESRRVLSALHAWNPVEPLRADMGLPLPPPCLTLSKELLTKIRPTRKLLQKGSRLISGAFYDCLEHRRC